MPSSWFVSLEMYLKDIKLIVYRVSMSRISLGLASSPSSRASPGSAILQRISRKRSVWERVASLSSPAAFPVLRVSAEVRTSQTQHSIVRLST